MHGGLIHGWGDVACAIRWERPGKGEGGRGERGKEREGRFILKSACNEFAAMLGAAAASAVECSWQRVGGDGGGGGRERQILWGEGDRGLGGRGREMDGCMER